MNMNQYQDVWFFQGCLKSHNSNKTYNITISKHDRFFRYMKPHFINEKVSGQEKVMIDSIIIEDPDKSFFDESTFCLNTIMLAKNKNNIVYGFEVAIEGLRLNKTSGSQVSYTDGKWNLSLVELVIPYCGRIEIVEREDQ